MQRLCIKVNLRVVSTVYPRDKTLQQLLHNKPNTDELMATSPSPRWISYTSPHASCKALQRAADQARGRLPALLRNNGWHHAARHRACFRRRPEATYFDVLPLDPLVDAITGMMPTKGEKGTYFCVSFQDVFDVVLGHNPLFCSNRLKFGCLFEVFIKSQCCTPSISKRST